MPVERLRESRHRRRARQLAHLYPRSKPTSIDSSKLQTPNPLKLTHKLRSSPLPMSDELITEISDQMDKMPYQRYISPSTISSGLRSALNLGALIQSAQNQPVEYPFGIGKYIAIEHTARINPFLPTIGVELEIPTGIEISQQLYDQFSKAVKIPSSQMHCAWEFSVPYSYSAMIQALILHQLIDLGYIPLDSEFIRPTLPKADGFSLHVNLGIPEALTTLEEGTSQYISFLDDSRNLAIACGLAFSSANRLITKKTTTVVNINRESEKSDKTAASSRQGRVELRPLGFGNIHSYRQLMTIQNLAATFLTYWQLEKNPDVFISYQPQAEQLRYIWKHFRRDLQSFINDQNISIEGETETPTLDDLFASTIDDTDRIKRRGLLKEMLTRTQIAIYMRQTLQQANFEIGQVINKL